MVLGYKLNWTYHVDGSINGFLLQSAYTDLIFELVGLADANTHPTMTPYQPRSPIDKILYKEMTGKMRSIEKHLLILYVIQLVLLATVTCSNLSIAIVLLSLSSKHHPKVTSMLPAM